MKTARARITGSLLPAGILLAAAALCLCGSSAQAMERKPPLHIKVGENGKSEKQPVTTPQTLPVNPDAKNTGKKPSTSCPLIITAKSANHYGLRVNLIRQDRRALQLATALREDFFRKGRDTQFISALYDASVQTGTDFELLVIKAMMESNLGTLNFAETTTARGAFQYIESTWLSLISRYGEKAGYPEYAKAVTVDPATLNASIAPGQEFRRAEILDLRFEPYVSALIKGLQIAEESAEIGKFSGGYVGITDHYVAHMLGLPLARRFYEMKNEGSQDPLADPSRPAMLAAAEKNRVFFYDKDGKSLTAAQSYAEFDRRVGDARKRLYAILRKFTSKRGNCRFEPVPAYEAQKPSPVAEQAKSTNVMNLSFFDTPLTPPTETGAQTPPVPETAAGEDKAEERQPEIKAAPEPEITPPPSAP